MARSFEELRQQMSPERRARSRRRAEEMLAELRLGEVRAACKLTQAELAERLNIDQPNVSRLENRSDVHVSTLAEYIAGLGGRLELRAVFPEGTVRIAGFGTAGDDWEARLEWTIVPGGAQAGVDLDDRDALLERMEGGGR